MRSAGLGISVAEWGLETHPPLLLAHGTGDSLRSFDGFAPLLAHRGWRVIAWDQRGHGDSDRAALYSWDADVRDSWAVMDSTGSERMPLIGHSKGGMLMTSLADACPHRVSHVVNLAGFPSRLMWWTEADPEVAEARVERLAGWLDRRRHGPGERRRRTRQELATSLRARNPRFPGEWIDHVVETAANHDGTGAWWKLDPDLDPSISQVMRQEWGLMGLPGLGMPVLVILGLIPEPTPMDQTPATLERYLPEGSRIVAFDDCGHFLHIERPCRTARLILDFLAESNP